MQTNHARRRIILIATLSLLVFTLTACTALTEPTPSATATGLTAAVTVPVAQTDPTNTAAAETGPGNSAAVAAPETAVYQTMTAEQAKQAMDLNPDAIILDVREPSEYATGHIKGAKLLPLGDIEAKAATELPDLNAEIFVYCRSGRRSKLAAEKLSALGYTQVTDFGGINSWPYEVVTD